MHHKFPEKQEKKHSSTTSFKQKISSNGRLKNSKKNKSPEQRSEIGIGIEEAEKSVFHQLSFTLIPFGAILVALACWLGYKATSANLSQSLQALPMFETSSQAEKMNQSLARLRNSLFHIANTDKVLSAQTVHENISFFFRGQEELVQEIGIKTLNGNGFMLFRDNGDFIEMDQEEASKGEYSPFRQLLMYNLSLKKASLFPTVFYTPSLSTDAEAPPGATVMRMALPIADGKIIVLGINLKNWRTMLVPFSENEMSAKHNIPYELDTFQLAYYFDNSGWILAEMSNQQYTEWRPDVSRGGYTGDIGRPGYDAAFRPWTEHENYWRMVTDVMDGKKGSLKDSNSHYSQLHKSGSGYLCYAPILFASDSEAEPLPVGGIGFFETTPLSVNTYIKIAGASLGIVALTVLLFFILIRRLSRKISLPFNKSVLEIDKMCTEKKLHYLSPQANSFEHRILTTSINKLVSLAKGQSERIDIMTKAMQETHAPLTLKLSKHNQASLLLGEFDLVGSSKKVAVLRESIRKAANAGTDVLVWGETGTGKELIASAIHKASPRKNGPYISINCGALDENLLMDTLFGHVAGAFSDAAEDRKGAFLAAHGGTLHLDEIGNASAKVQQSLLRALSARCIRPLGSDTEIEFDTKVIAATNIDLRQCVEEGSFRQDLYYRLAIINIETPPLRDRKEDIAELAAFYMIETAKEMQKKTALLSRGALKLLTEYPWPGNIRELKNCIIRTVAYVDDDLILPEHLAFLKGYGEDSHINKKEKSPVHTSKAYSPHSYAESNHWFFSPADSDFKADKESYKSPDRLASPSEYKSNLSKAENPDFYSEKNYQSPPASTAFKENNFNGKTFNQQSENYKDLNGNLSPGEVKNAPSYYGELDQKTYCPYPRGYDSGLSKAVDCFSISSSAENLKTKNGQHEGKSHECKDRESFKLYEEMLEKGELNHRQLLALRLAYTNDSFTRSDFEEAGDATVSSRTVQNDLRGLVDLNLLVRAGSGPATYYHRPGLEESKEQD